MAIRRASTLVDRRTRLSGRMWIDCTSTLRMDVGTGIQRVVRNLLAHAHRTSCDCRMAAHAGGEWFDVTPAANHASDATGGEPAESAGRRRSGWTTVRRQVRRLATRVANAVAPRQIRRRIKEQGWKAEWSSMYAKADLRSGDVMLLADATWTNPFPPSIDELHHVGLQVGLLVYDLICLTHPHFFPPPSADIFATWFRGAVSEVDFVVADSNTVCDTIRNYLRTQLPNTLAPEFVASFPLGVSLDRQQTGGPVRVELLRAFEVSAPSRPSATAASGRDERNTYLSVSTLEPRKNHALLVDAFEELWRSGSDLKLCLVGRAGWLIEPLVERLERHPERGRRLFWFRDLSDSELTYCYANARAFLFPSFVEGYGLPIAEALQHGLSVLVSDTPVHREVAGDFACYFDPHRPAELAELVRRFHAGQTRPTLPAEKYHPVEWTTSVRELVDVCLRLAASSRGGRPSTSAAA